MGIKGLRKLLRTKAPSSVNQIKLTKYTGKAVAIDCSSYMYQFRYNAAKKGKGSHLRAFYEMIVALLQHNIIPVFVFDGKPPKEKDTELQKRRDVNDTRVKKIESIQSTIDEILLGRKLYDETITQTEAKQITELLKELEKKKKNNINVNQEHFSDAVELFNCAGIPCLKSSSEADFLCVKLCRDGITSAVISEDMDILTHGAEYLITGINDNPFRRDGIVTEYCLSNALSELELDMNQFIDICILCKCDYAGKITGISGITAIKLIKKYVSIDKLMELIEKGKLHYKPQTDFNYKRARELFKSSLDISYPANKVRLCRSDKTKLTKLLLSSTNYSKCTLMKKLEICRTCFQNINVTVNVSNNNTTVSSKKQAVQKKTAIIKKKSVFKIKKKLVKPQIILKKKIIPKTCIPAIPEH